MHKTIGIIGGMTPESTTLYYEHITRTYQERYGDYGFPRVVINSMSFQRFVDWMLSDDWDSIAHALTLAVNQLAAAGSEIALIATNTMHLVYDIVSKTSPVPMISIIDTTAQAVLAKRLKRVALLGTRFTMERDFYRNGLAKFSIESIVPEQPDRVKINRIIFDELGKGVIDEYSRSAYLDVISRLADRGAEGIILGCTEIPLLIGPEHCDIPLFNTSVLHAEAALKAALTS